MTGYRKLYETRRYSEGYPDLERAGVEWYAQHQQQGTETDPRGAGAIPCIRRLIDIEQPGQPLAVIGCGPQPRSIQNLLEQGFRVVGVEPVAGSAAKAREFLKGEGEVVQGAAEQIPLPDASQRIVLLESVLEHVDSPERCIAECYRILEPGGVLFVYTTNRYRFSLVGRNQEYTTRYFNWFPRLVKEMYVFHHLHYDPRLASYTPRPGVHWFSYADLCALGRRAGFGQFYSKLDLADPDSPIIARSWLRRRLYQACKYRPWLKALALLQFGNSIFMWKRPE